MKQLSFDNFGTRLRAGINIDGEPMFCANDVAKVLGYRDAANMLRIVDDEDKGTQLMSTPGGTQVMSTVNEAGLYQAILRSNKPQSKEFKKWVTKEVLPSIRKTGKYVLPQNSSFPKEHTEAIILEVIQEYKCMEEYLQRNQPKIDFANIVLQSKESITLSEYAKLIHRYAECEVGEKRLFEWLYSNHYFMKSSYSKPIPYQKYLDNGYFEVKYMYKSINLDGSTANVPDIALVTPLGQVALASEVYQHFSSLTNSSRSSPESKSNKIFKAHMATIKNDDTFHKIDILNDLNIRYYVANAQDFNRKIS